MKKFFACFLLFFLLIACQDDYDVQPKQIDQEQEMVQIMDYTAQVVSQVMISNSARGEILGHAYPENAGEVEVSFESLLSNQPKKRSLVNDAKSGSFAERFRPLAERFKAEQTQEKSSAVNDVISDLEQYLKDNNLGLYGPYLAENHHNTSEPITVSFDPLDPNQSTNYGYKMVPKNSGQNSANSGDIDVTKSTDQYNFVLVEGIDDNYAYDHPVLVIVPLDGDGTSYRASNATSTNGQSPLPIPSNGIQCSNLQDGDLLRPIMQRFRLTDNLRSGFWNRNLLNLYAITADDVTFDINGKAQINTSVAQVWREVRVSRSDARNKRWLDANQLLDSNWTGDEDNLFLAVSFKKTRLDLEIQAEVSKNGVTFKPKLGLESKHHLLMSFSHDKCADLALFKTASSAGLENGRHIFKFGNFEYTLDMLWYR